MVDLRGFIFLFKALVDVIHCCLGIIGMVIVILGVVQAIKVAVRGVLNGQLSAQLYKKSRLLLCQHILFGLEFMVASDVVLTVIAYDVHQLYKLALLVLIRTVLSYFLDKELKELEQ